MIKKLFLLLIFLFLGACSESELDKNKLSNQYYICNQTEQAFIESLNLKTKEEKIMLESFNYYGESLNLYTTEYIPGINNIKGFFILKDLCTDLEYRFPISDFIDENIEVYLLNDGFYQIHYLDENNQLFDLQSKSNIMSDIYTITRNKTNKHVVLASSEYYLGNNNVYLSVKKAKLPTNVYDVIIDPGHGGFNETLGVIDTGVVVNNLVESDENFYTSERMKKNLEAAGLKVSLTRNHINDAINSVQRIERVYESSAKYVFSNHLNSSEEMNVDGGFFAFSSHLTSKKIAIEITENISYKLYNSISWNGIGQGYRIYDECPNLDYYYIIRSVGGLATTSPNCNATYYPNIRGVSSVLIEHLYASSKQDSNYWKENKDTLIDEVSQGIINALKLN